MKKILIRIDFNGLWRIKRSIRTINYWQRKGAEKIIIIGHYGRPHGKKVKSLSLLRFKKYLPDSVKLLENLRFDPGEEANDISFAKELARQADIFVNDAFGVSHRKHASIVGLPKFLPSYFGLSMRQEIDILSQEFERPLIFILGGAKVKTKRPLVKILKKKCDQLLLGGLLGNVIKGENNYDIDQQTIESFKEKIRQAKTIIWNGPLGVIERPEHSVGSKEIIRAIINSSAFSIVGGGELVALIESLGLTDRFSHISTGGGAMLEFLAKGTLPGIEAINENLERQKKN